MWSTIRKNRYALYRRLLKLPEGVLVDAHMKTGGHVLKLIIVLLIISFFCAHTLTGSSDKDLLITSSLALPLKLGRISFLQFLVVGPMCLSFLSLCLQIYYQHYRMLDRVIRKLRYTQVPVVSEVNHSFVKLFNQVVIFTLVPTTMVFYTQI